MTQYGRTGLAAVGTIAMGLAFHGQPAWAAQERVPFDVAEVFFELNNTDGDLGIHALIDGEPWRRLAIRDPKGRGLLAVRLSGRLRRQGLTELFYESDEPSFEELSPEAFFERFAEGTYRVSGVTLEGDKLRSSAEITHLMPAPPRATVNGVAAAEDCDEPAPAIAAPIVISWDPVTLSHPDLGRMNEPIEVVRYQVVVEREEPPFKISVDLDPDATSFALPAGLLSSGDAIKYEILVRELSGNQTALESCFDVP